MAPSRDKWVRRFVITEVGKHKEGFTVYKVTSVVFSRSVPECKSKVFVWKRYNDFKRLHSQLKLEYSKLKIEEPFPSFPKRNFFGRFKDDVLNDRRECALKLLEFVARHPSLYTNDTFIRFFDTSQLGDGPNQRSRSTSSETSEDDASYVKGDSESLDKSRSNVAPRRTTKVLQKPADQLPKLICTETIEPALTKDTFPFDSMPGSTSRKAGLFRDENKVVSESYQHSWVLENNSTGDESRLDSRATRKSGLPFSLPSDKSTRTNDTDECESDSIVGTRTTIHDGSDLSDTLDRPPRYIAIAAAHMSAAYRHEAIAEYRDAFIQYKLGISSLVYGIQKDPDPCRRSAIREKVSKYLERAEKLYNRHLNCNVSVLSKPVIELQNYKVLRVMGSVMLVRHVQQKCNRIVKTFEKASNNKDEINNYILRGNVPYMIQLHACVQTETTVFLVLEYASKGKLWDYIKSKYRINKDEATDGNNHTESISNDNSLVETNSGNQRDIDSERLNGIGRRESSYASRDDMQWDFGSTEHDEINNQNAQTKRDELRIDSMCGKDVTTTALVENANKLLQSVDETLKKSNSIANRLNESERLPYNHEGTNGRINERSLNLTDEKKWARSSTGSLSPVPDLDNTPADEPTENQNEYDLLPSDLAFSSNDDTKDSCDPNQISTSVSKIRDLSLDAMNSRADSDEYPVAESGCDTTANGTSNQIISGEECSPMENETMKREERNEALRCDFECNSQINENSGIDMETVMWDLPEDKIRHWAAQILLALESLHQQNVMVSDLRPDNILLDDAENVAMTYVVPCHSAKLLQPRKPYVSPELCMFSPAAPATLATDVWSFGVLLYELLTGIPFQSRHPGPFHSHSIINIPENVCQDAKALLLGVLKYQPNDRLTIPEIKQHAYFEMIDWSKLLTP